MGMPLPEGTPPANLVGFKRISIQYVWGAAVTSTPMSLHSSTAFALCSKRASPLSPFSNGADLMRHQMEQLQNFVSPTILLNCADLRMIYSMYFFSDRPSDVRLA
ncbi:hypothetical protein GPALN_007501 [Globodera pallida]|nr:hypothetical protein GPALN_007501 [Globodera pallida]